MWWNFLSGLYAVPYKVMLLVRANPLGIFIYGILANWYVVIVVGSVVVTYWVFKGLEEIGLLSSGFNILVEALHQSKAIAQNCTPKILHINEWWNCISDPGTYKPAVGEQELNDISNKINEVIHQNKTAPPNPYNN